MSWNCSRMAFTSSLQRDTLTGGETLVYISTPSIRLKRVAILLRASLVFQLCMGRTLWLRNLTIMLYVEKLCSMRYFLLFPSIAGSSCLESASGAGRQHWCSSSCTGIPARATSGPEASVVSAVSTDAAAKMRSCRALQRRMPSPEGTGTVKRLVSAGR